MSKLKTWLTWIGLRVNHVSCILFLGLRVNPMLGGWVNPHREQQTIPQGQTSIPPKYFSTPTANGQIAPWSGSARGVGRGAGSHTPSTASESFSHEDEDVPDGAFDFERAHWRGAPWASTSNGGKLHQQARDRRKSLLKVPCAPKWFNFEFPIIKTTKLLVETCSLSKLKTWLNWRERVKRLGSVYVWCGDRIERESVPKWVT